MDQYDGLREQVSLLLSEGHVHARRYPLAMVGVEADIAMRRVNLAFVTQSTLMQACIGSVMNGKKGGKHYQELIRKLQSG